MGGIFILILAILVVSFILALRTLPELEVPKEVKEAVNKARQKRVSGIFLFFRDKVLHYPTPGNSSSGKASSSVSGSSNATVSGLTKGQYPPPGKVG
ncbi:MAG: hypothetical protein LiPW16_158 [Microgenomates group bacterium LiPW_16]|nr:MAG: hypothetical protein LiPW16_158 [Microgenomates group bacterium LiPW_16]